MTPFIPSGRFWRTVEDQEFTLSDGQKICIPAGYEFDGHSLPPFLHAFMNPYSYDMYAALLHDALYDMHNEGSIDITRSQADREYLQLMQQLGTNWLRRSVFYSAVRIFGGLWWNT